MIQYFYGEDIYRAREAIEEIATSNKARVRWWDREDLEDGLGELLSGGDSLFGRQMSVVRDVSDLPVSWQDKILDNIQDKGLSLVVLWDRREPDKRGRLYKGLKDKARQFVSMDLATAERWVENHVKQQQGVINREAAQELVRRVGTDSWRLIAEIDKLLLVTNKITVEMIKEIPASESAEIFAVLDCLAQGKKKEAIVGIENLLAQGHGEFYIIAMLAYQFRTLWQIKSGGGNKLSSFVRQKNQAAAQRYSVGDLREALTIILATDFAIKQGRVEPRTGLMMLCLSLSR